MSMGMFAQNARQLCHRQLSAIAFTWRTQAVQTLQTRVAPNMRLGVLVDSICGFY